MTALRHTQATLDIGHSSDLSPTATVARWWAGVREHRARRNSIAELSNLDAASLRDIGVTRGEIAALVDQRLTKLRFAKRV